MNTERFLRTASEYLDLEDPAGSNREAARTLLTEEFIEALADGPDTLVSVPPGSRSEELPVWRVVRAMMYSDPNLSHALCHELSCEMPDVPMLLASTYSTLWMAYLDAAQALGDKEIHHDVRR